MLRGEQVEKSNVRIAAQCPRNEQRASSKTHVSTKSQQLDDHLNGEHHREDHVEDVHDGGKGLGLLVMLEEKQRKHVKSSH